MTDAIFLEAAQRIGQRLLRSAIPQPTGVSWIVNRPDMSARPAARTIEVLADSHVYQGASGVALFLSELGRQTGVRRFTEAASDAIRFASQSLIPIDGCGFYCGRVGVAFTAARLAYVSQSDEMARLAKNTLEPLLACGEPSDTLLDAVGGAGGAIAPLHLIASYLGDERYSDLAIALSEHLVRKATQHVVGWSWGGLGSGNVRHLIGYAHGVSGIALGLLEAYAATGRSDFLYAAEQGFAYERLYFDPEIKNWPDFRHREIANHLLGNSTDELRRLAQLGEVPKFETQFMCAWCHGAPGMAPTRARAFQLTGRAVYVREADNAIAATISTIAPSDGMRTRGYSLCHGFAGNADSVLTCARILSNKKLETEVCDLVAEAARRFEFAGRSWPSGAIGHKKDPSLLIGDAGIGFLLLRCANPETESILCSSLPYGRPDAPDDSDLAVRASHLSVYLGLSQQVLDLDIDEACIGSRATEPGTEVLQFAEVVRDAVSVANDQASAEEIFALEKQRIDLDRLDHDLCADYLASLSLVGTDLMHVRVRLRTNVRIVRIGEAARASHPLFAAVNSVFFYQSQMQARSRAGSRLEALMADALAIPRSGQEIVDQLAAKRDSARARSSDVYADTFTREAVKATLSRWASLGMIEYATHQQPC